MYRAPKDSQPLSGPPGQPAYMGPPRTASLYRAPKDSQPISDSQGQPACIGPPRTASLYRAPKDSQPISGPQVQPAYIGPPRTASLYRAPKDSQPVSGPQGQPACPSAIADSCRAQTVQDSRTYGAKFDVTRSSSQYLSLFHAYKINSHSGLLANGRSYADRGCTFELHGCH
jgi:hypothetical protein